MAGACYPERYQAISFHLGHLLVPSLHKDGRSRTGIYRQLGQYGYPGSVRLECIRFIYYVSGFIGYLILAHYLVKYPLQWSWRKTLAIGIPMFVTGYAITFGGYLIMQEYFPGNYAYLEIVWLFGGINVFMMTFPVLSVYRSLKYLLRLFFQKWHP